MIQNDKDTNDDKDDDDTTTSSAGEGGGGGRQPAISTPDEGLPILRFEDLVALSDSENAIDTLMKLKLAPMSMIAVGATAFAAENDLSRKVFMAEVGLFNREISPRDIANSNLIKILDERQAQRRAYFGIKTLDEMISGAAGAIGAAGAAITAVVASAKDYIRDKREERRLQKLAQKFEAGATETSYALDDDTARTADFPMLDNQANDMAKRLSLLQGVELTKEEDLEARVEAAHLAMMALDTKDVTSIFNIVADLMKNDPVKKKDKAQMSLDASGAEIAPGADKAFSPTGD